MYVIAGAGLLIAGGIYFFHIPISTDVPHALYVSWPVFINTFVMYALSKIDLGPFATLYQRNNRLRTKITRLEEGH